MLIISRHMATWPLESPYKTKLLIIFLQKPAKYKHILTHTVLLLLLFFLLFFFWKKGATVENKPQLFGKMGVDGAIVSVGKATETLFTLPCDASVGTKLMGATRWFWGCFAKCDAH